MTRFHVDEVNVDAVDRRYELGNAFSFASAFRQSYRVRPVADELLQLCQLRSLRAVGHRFPVRPPRRRKPPAQVVEIGLRHLDAERPNGGSVIVCSGRGSTDAGGRE